MAAPKKTFKRKGNLWDREAVIDFVCAQIASSSMGVAAALEQAKVKMPLRQTVMEWIAGSEVFADKYARAKQQQAEYLAEELLEIADDGTNDYVTRQNADGSEYEVLNGEHVQRSRLRIDTRKWLMSKLLPKKYGERITHDGSIGIAEMTEEQINNRIAQLVADASDTNAES